MSFSYENGNDAVPEHRAGQQQQQQHHHYPLVSMSMSMVDKTQKELKIEASMSIDYLGMLAHK